MLKNLLEQLQALGWEIILGDKTNPESTLRNNFKEVLINDLFKTSIKKINTFLEVDQIDEVFNELKKINKPEI